MNKESMAGFLMKHIEQCALSTESKMTWSDVYRRRIYIYQCEVIVMERAALNKLTAQERKVLDLLEEGKTYKEIAEILVLSVHTVDSHIRNIYGKLGVRNRTQAAIMALRGKLKR